MMPAAAVAAIRAAVEDAHRRDLDQPEDVAEHVVGELEAQGWTVVDPILTRPRPAA